jgi:hypothetical protein
VPSQDGGTTKPTQATYNIAKEPTGINSSKHVVHMHATGDVDVWAAVQRRLAPRIWFCALAVHTRRQPLWHVAAVRSERIALNLNRGACLQACNLTKDKICQILACDMRWMKRKNTPLWLLIWLSIDLCPLEKTCESTQWAHVSGGLDLQVFSKSLASLSKDKDRPCEPQLVERKASLLSKLGVTPDQPRPLNFEAFMVVFVFFISH